MPSVNPLLCPRCNTHVDEHPAGNCLDAWIADIRGFQIVELCPGEQRVVITEDKELSIVEEKTSRDKLFLLANKKQIGGIASIFKDDCLIRIPPYSSHSAQIDEMATADKPLRDAFENFLGAQLARSGGEGMSIGAYGWFYRDRMACIAYIKTNLGCEVTLHDDEGIQGAE